MESELIIVCFSHGLDPRYSHRTLFSIKMSFWCFWKSSRGVSNVLRKKIKSRIPPLSPSICPINFLSTEQPSPVKHHCLCCFPKRKCQKVEPSWCQDWCYVPYRNRENSCILLDPCHTLSLVNLIRVALWGGGWLYNYSCFSSHSMSLLLGSSCPPKAQFFATTPTARDSHMTSVCQDSWEITVFSPLCLPTSAN